MCITCTFSCVLSFFSLQQACFVVALSGVDLVASSLREENQQVCQWIWDGISEWNHGRVSVFLCLCVCVCVHVCVYVRVCVRVCVCVLFYLHVFKCMYMYVHVQSMCVYVCPSQCLIPRISTTVVSMDVKNIKLLHEKPYRVSWKADGTSFRLGLSVPFSSKDWFTI